MIRHWPQAVTKCCVFGLLDLLALDLESLEAQRIGADVGDDAAAAAAAPRQLAMVLEFREVEAQHL